jgi:uncharacterized membrane protein
MGLAVSSIVSGAVSGAEWGSLIGQEGTLAGGLSVVLRAVVNH